MTPPLDPFFDMEDAFELLILAAKPALGSFVVAGKTFYHIGTETPIDLKSVLDFVRLGWLEGSDDGITVSGVMDIDVFSATRVQARLLANEIREIVRPVPSRAQRAGPYIIDSVDTDRGPSRVPWSDPTVRRYYASYRVSARR